MLCNSCGSEFHSSGTESRSAPNNNYYLEKVNKIRNDMSAGKGKLSQEMIKNQITKDKKCQSLFKCITEEEIEKLLKSINRDCGFDNTKHF